MRNYRSIPPTPLSVWKKPLHFIAFGFGSGAIPFAPGTFGSLVAIPFFLLLQPLSMYAYLAALFLITAFSIWISDRLSTEINVHDHQGMNIDEIVGMLFALFCLPPTFLWISAGFLLFRFFDIYKPWPISFLDQKIDGGFGMIIDDVAAGIASCAILHIIRAFL